MANFINRLRGGSRSGNEGSAPGVAHTNSISLVPGKLIGAGGEGAVYEDQNDPRMVIKVLHPQQATAERVAKLRAMCQNPPQNAEALSWPNILEGGVGELRFRMPRAASATATVYRFISANERRQLPKKQQEYEYRATLGVNIAEAFRWLHAIHVRIGDVNPSNILVGDDGSVTVIDCDSFQIPGPPGHQPYPCTVGSPEYTAAEIDDFRRQFRSQDSDNFALAVLLYQLLGNGSHPYQGIDASATDAVSNIRELCTPAKGQALETDGGTNPELAGYAWARAGCLPTGFFPRCVPHWTSNRRCLGQHSPAESRAGPCRTTGSQTIDLDNGSCATGLAGRTAKCGNAVQSRTFQCPESAGSGKE